MDIENVQNSMDKAIGYLKDELSKLRVGRATVSMVDGIKVLAYGNQVTIKEVATLSIQDARTLIIAPWDTSLMTEIEKSILAANLGITPMNDGKTIRLTLPPLTEDRRKDFVKKIKKMGEDSKITLRNIRRDTLDAIKKNKELSLDISRKLQDDIQKITDVKTKKIDEIIDAKCEDILTL